MKHEQVMLSIIESSKHTLTMRELFLRTMMIMGETGDADELLRKCGYEPDDVVFKGENFTPAVRIIPNQ
jgi:hypothetical protein